MVGNLFTQFSDDEKRTQFMQNPLLVAVLAGCCGWQNATPYTKTRLRTKNKNWLSSQIPWYNVLLPQKLLKD